MTKTISPKAPRLTKAQKAEQAITNAISLQAQELATEVTETEVTETEVTETEVYTEVTDDNWIDPVKWIDETPSLDQAMASLVSVKSHKKVKTVKTGVGTQILFLIAQGKLSNKEIVAKVLEDNPLRKTTYACVAWYKSQVTAGKIDLPAVQEETSEE